jgi:hypothetical protein
MALKDNRRRSAGIDRPLPGCSTRRGRFQGARCAVRAKSRRSKMPISSLPAAAASISATIVACAVLMSGSAGIAAMIASTGQGHGRTVLDPDRLDLEHPRQDPPDADRQALRRAFFGCQLRRHPRRLQHPRGRHTQIAKFPHTEIWHFPSPMAGQAGPCLLPELARSSGCANGKHLHGEPAAGSAATEAGRKATPKRAEGSALSLSPPQRRNKRFTKKEKRAQRGKGVCARSARGDVQRASPDV